MKIKTCSRCNRSRPVEQFSKNKLMLDGRLNQCRSCESIAKRAYYLKNAEKLKERSRQWHRDHRSKAVARSREYYAEHRQAILAQMRDARRTPDGQMKQRERKRAYYQSHHDEILAYQRKYRVTAAGKAVARKAAMRAKKLHKLRLDARSYLNNAVRDGRVARPRKCSECGRKCKTEAHHHLGYERRHWLDVKWCCLACHKKADKHK